MTSQVLGVGLVGHVLDSITGQSTEGKTDKQ